MHSHSAPSPAACIWKSNDACCRLISSDTRDGWSTANTTCADCYIFHVGEAMGRTLDMQGAATDTAARYMRAKCHKNQAAERRAAMQRGAKSVP